MCTNVHAFIDQLRELFKHYADDAIVEIPLWTVVGPVRVHLVTNGSNNTEESDV